MDEEEILRSSLEQSNKIDIGNFFGSPIGGLANRALLQSNTSLKSTTNNLNLIRALQTSIESLRSEIQQITNYIIVDKQERNKILQRRELEEFEREDAIQKGLVRPESAQPTGLEDSLPFFPEARFSEGLTAGMSSIGERQGVAQFQERFVEGSKPFFFGGLVPGSGNADTVNAKLTPGEFIVPKEKVEELGSNPLIDFVKGGGLFGALGRAFTGGKERESGFSKENYDQGRLSRKDFSSRKDYVEYMKQFDDKENKGFFSKLFGGKKNENVKKNDYFVNPEDATNMSDVPRYVKDAGGNFVVAPTTEQLTKGFSTYDDDDFTKSEKKENKGIFGGLFGGGKKETQSGFSKENYDMGRLSRKDFKNDEDFEFYKNQFGDAFDVDSVKSDDKRGLFGMIGGSVDAMTGGLTDLDRRGGKPFGLMRGITGSIDAATGGLTDLDRRGGKPFGLMRGITGSIDAMTGGLTDLDRRGGKPFGTMRLATGVADAMTGNLFDFDRRGRGEEEKKKLRDKDGRYIGDNVRKKNFQKMMDKNLYNKASQLPMETTVNPDGSITSEGSGTFIGGELVKPGEPLTPMQRAAMTMNIQMGNTYSSEIMEKYNNAGGAPSKEEFDNYEKEKSKSVKPDKEKSKNIKPEQTLGEKFMNMFRGDKKEKGSQLLSSAPSSKYSPNTSISSDDSIKTAAKGLMSPPPPPPSETIELPPQIQGDDGGGGGIQGGVSPFQPSTPGYTGLSPTKSPMPFIDVISNQYLSVV